jgi:hypothetical protein
VADAEEGIEVGEGGGEAGVQELHLMVCDFDWAGISNCAFLGT